MGVTASQILRIAAAEIGTLEGRDPDGNWNNRVKYSEWYGIIDAWCAMFVSWVFWRAGVLGVLAPKYASTFAGLTWFRKNELTGNWPPRPGDVFIMSAYHPEKAGAWNDTTGTGWLTIHTGLVEKYLGDGWFQTIEGNTNTSGSSQGNGVYRLKRQDTEGGHRFIFARPKYDPEPVVVAPTPAPTPVVTAPKPTAPKPIPGATYTGSRTIDISQLKYASTRPKFRCEAARRWNGLVWAWLCKNSPEYCRKNLAAWLNEPSAAFGREGQRATQEMYRILNIREPKVFSRVTLPTWPGDKAIRKIGGTPVA